MSTLQYDEHLKNGIQTVMNRSINLFISYSNRYETWVEDFQSNLKNCVSNARRTHEIVLDKTDLGVGQQWTTQLQADNDPASRFLLVVTPETFALSKVARELKNYIGAHPDWKEKLQILLLVHTPLPPFLPEEHCVDFRCHNAQTYLAGLWQITSSLLDLQDLPERIPGARRPKISVPWKIRSRLIAWMEKALKDKVSRHAIADVLNFQIARLQGQPSDRCAAAAVLVLAAGKDDPLSSTIRIVEALRNVFEEDEHRELSRLLEKLRKKPQARRAGFSVQGLLAAYLRIIERDNSKLVLLDETASPDILQGLELELDMRSATQEERRDVLLKFKNPCLPIEGFLRLDPDDHPWISRRWVLLGDPGSGKTTLLRHLAWKLARKTQPEWVPLYDSLPRLIQHPESLFDQAVDKVKQEGYVAEGLISVLNDEAQKGRLLLLLDGLDEVGDFNQAKVILGKLSDRWPETPIIVTSRTTVYENPAFEFKELKIRTLNQDSQRKFLAAWFGRSEDEPNTQQAKETLARLGSDPGLKKLAGNPLYLTLMARLMEAGTPPNLHRPQLYQEVFEILITAAHRPHTKPAVHKLAVHQMLRRFAFEMTTENEDKKSVAILKLMLLQDDHLRKFLQEPKWKNDLQILFDDVAEAGILVPTEAPDGEWKFIHRTFQEAHTAQELKGRLDDNRDEFMSKVKIIKGNEKQWSEPYSLLTGLVDTPDDLVQELLEINYPLGLRAIATAQNLDPETLINALKLTDDWRDRRNVYQRLPDLIGDHDGTLVLLEQLGRIYHNGNDLFCIEQAARIVEQRSSDHEEAVKDLCWRLYSSISAPPDDLFRRTTTAIDGSVELWRTIPRGNFLMGSPPQESNNDDEKPLHTVSVTSPFRIAAVPITNVQYGKFDPDHDFDENCPHHPVVNITWFEAIAFCRWLSISFPWARGVRLPLEEEWEYCCRAGGTNAYWNGNEEKDLEPIAWYKANSEKRIHPIGEKPANPWGLYDIHGNVWEWTLSPQKTEIYQERRSGYAVDPATVPLRDLVKANEERRVIRGGSVMTDALYTRSANRGYWKPEDNENDLGFRLVLPVENDDSRRGSA